MHYCEAPADRKQSLGAKESWTEPSLVRRRTCDAEQQQNYFAQLQTAERESKQQQLQQAASSSCFRGPLVCEFGRVAAAKSPDDDDGDGQQPIGNWKARVRIRAKTNSFTDANKLANKRRFTSSKAAIHQLAVDQFSSVRFSLQANRFVRKTLCLRVCFITSLDLFDLCETSKRKKPLVVGLSAIEKYYFLDKSHRHKNKSWASSREY